jgi:hypothetical protein
MSFSQIPLSVAAALMILLFLSFTKACFVSASYMENSGKTAGLGRQTL